VILEPGQIVVNLDNIHVEAAKLIPMPIGHSFMSVTNGV